MVTIQSLLQVGDELVPLEELKSPVLDEEYIEGAIELSVDHKPILTRELADLVDQLWSYLLEGLEEVLAGRELTTSYPDMPVEIVLRPEGKQVTIRVDRKKGIAEATLPIDDLRKAMVPAARQFFQHLRPFVNRRQGTYDRNLARLAALG